MRILITGVNGYIGSKLAKKLIEEGHDVIGMIRQSSNLHLLGSIPVKLIYGDFTNQSSLPNVVAGIDIVIHAGGMVSDWGNYSDFEKANFEGTKNMVAVSQNAHVKRFIHISTVAVHGFGFQNATEEYLMPNLENAYAKTKKMSELWLSEFSKTHSMELVIIRPGNVYGPDDHKFIKKYLQAIEKQQFAFIKGGSSLTCPSYIDNLVCGIILSCFHPKAAGETFIITDGLYINWKEFTCKLVRQLGLPLPKFSTSFPFAYALAYINEWFCKVIFKTYAPLLTRYRINNGGKDYHFSITKARRILGYEPRVDINEAVHKTIKWYVTQIQNK